MARTGIFGLAVLIGFVMSCGGDKPTESVHELVGSWVYQRSEFSATAARNLQSYMVNQGLDLTAAVRLVTEFRNAVDSGFRDTGLEIVRFNQDRTYERQFRQFGSLVRTGQRPHDGRGRRVYDSVPVLCGRRRTDAPPEQGAIPEHWQAVRGFG